MKKTVVLLITVMCIICVMAGCGKRDTTASSPPVTSPATEPDTKPQSTAESETIMEFPTASTTVPESQTATESETEPENEERNQKLIIATDLHYLSDRLTDGGAGFKYMVEHGDGKLAHYVWEITDAFIEEVIAEQPQALILSGDLSLNGEILSHKELAKKLRRIEAADIPVVVIPGNHDINCSSAAAFVGQDRRPAAQTSPEEFAAIYGKFGYDEAVSRDPASLSYVYQLDDYTRLLMLDTCQYDGHALVGGMIDLETYEWIDKQLEAAWEEGKNVIPVAHHNLLEESQVYLNDCTIEHAEVLEEMLSRWSVTVFFSGHLHVQHFKTSAAYGIDEIVTSSLSTAPCQYGIVQYKDDGSFRYQTRAVDVTRWAQSQGIENRHLLKFPSYSSNMLSQVFYNQVMDRLKYEDIPRLDKKKMADFYAKLNTWSYAGKAFEIADECRNDPAYALWQQYKGESTQFHYIEEILQDAVQDYNAFSRDG